MRQNYATNRYINQLNATPDRYAGKYSSNQMQRSPLVNESRMSNVMNYNEIKNNFSKILIENQLPKQQNPTRESRIYTREPIDYNPVCRNLNKHHNGTIFGLKGSRSREQKVLKNENSSATELKRFESSKITITNESKSKYESKYEGRETIRDPRDDRSLSEYKPSTSGNNLMKVKDVEIENLRKEIANLKENCNLLENRYYTVCLIKDEIREKLISSEKANQTNARELISRYNDIKSLESFVNSFLRLQTNDQHSIDTQRRSNDEEKKSLKNLIDQLNYELNESKLSNMKIVEEKDKLAAELVNRDEQITKLNSIVRNYQEKIIDYYKRNSEVKYSNDLIHPNTKEGTTEFRDSTNRSITSDSPGDKLNSPEISFKISIHKENRGLR